MKNIKIGFDRRNHHEIADIFNLYGEQYREHNSISCEQAKVMHHIQVCRTAALGGHVEQCNECGYEKIAYNSCRNRHCPKCQTMTKEKWLNARKAELLPCGYFHLVFTLPHTLNPIILCNKKTMLTILFASVNATLQAFAKDPQWRLNGQLGIIAVLHTWSQTLLDHFHLHCLVPAGALSSVHNKWNPTRKNFLFQIKSLAKGYRKQYLHKLNSAYQQKKLIFPGKTASIGSQKIFEEMTENLSKIDWIAYAKRPFAGPEQVLEYLGRYTHRIAISNNRLISIGKKQVIFTYSDRKNDNEKKTMTLDAEEFIRRFLLHVLPKGFMKIRYFGFLSDVKKKKCIQLIRQLLNHIVKLPDQVKETVQQIMQRITGIDITCCPKCKKGKMITVKELPRPVWNTS
ncbi:MAG: IS91 family transposase [Desulfobulbaceae bacterium]|nr:IS91 family transposase [Desulfobulbaceae bacterium]